MTEPAIYTGERARPVSEVRERASRIAAGMRAMGVQPDDRYAIVLRNEVAFVEATMAGGQIGAVPVAVNWHWTGDDLRHLLSNSESKVAFVHTDLLPAVLRHAPDYLQVIEVEVPPEITEAYGMGEVPLTGEHPTLEDLVAQNEPVTDPIMVPPSSVIYTSGTTGLAKGILRERMKPELLPRVVEGVQDLLKIAPGEKTLVPAPMYHSSPNAHFIWATAIGATVFLMPRFDPIEFMRLVDKYKIDSTQMVPVMFRRMLAVPAEERAKYDMSSLKSIVHVAAPCPPDLKEAMIDWVGPIINEYYGGSEGGAWTYVTSPESLKKPGTVGRAFREAEVVIIGADGEPAPPGEQGMIYGRNRADGPDFTYIGNDEKRRDIARGDFITVGDIGYLDEDGYLFLCDRANDMVISGGVNIYPAEIESSLHNLDGVEDVAVFGIPDPEMGEGLAAHIQLREGAELSEDDVRTFVRDNLAAYKVPKVVVFEDKLPREDSGKLFKRRLKDQYWADGKRISG